MKTSSLRPALAALAVLVLAAACSSGGGATWTFAPPPPTPSPGPATPSPEPTVPPTTAPMSMPPASAAPSGGPQASGEPEPSGAIHVIELDENASLQITRDGSLVTELTVKLGETVHFKITNTAGYAHNFYIGKPDALGQNNVSGLPGIPDFSGGTQEFDYTVTADTAGLQWGCSLPGHYPSMHGTFVVEP